VLEAKRIVSIVFSMALERIAHTVRWEIAALRNFDPV
jgi:hypothetical protein